MALKLSIITVVYNQKNNLASTIKSVQEQSFKDFEHLIIDGDSSDGTKEVLKKFKNQITYISEPDKGLYDAMNKGIKLATGKYIMFLNAGDLFYDNTVLENIFKSSNEEDLLYAKAVFVDDSGNEKPWHKKTPTPDKLSYKSFINGSVINHQSMIIKRSKALPYNLKWQIVSDIDWSIRCLKQCNSYFYYSHYLCKFQEGGISDKHRKKAHKERLLLFIEHFGILKTTFQHLIFIFKWIIKLTKKQP